MNATVKGILVELNLELEDARDWIDAHTDGLSDTDTLFKLEMAQPKLNAALHYLNLAIKTIKESINE